MMSTVARRSNTSTRASQLALLFRIGQLSHHHAQLLATYRPRSTPFTLFANSPPTSSASRRFLGASLRCSMMVKRDFQPISRRKAKG